MTGSSTSFHCFSVKVSFLLAPTQKLEDGLLSQNNFCPRANLYVCFLIQSCLTLCDPLDCSPPGSSVHGIFQARILEWVAIFLLQLSLLLSPKDSIRTELKCIIPSFPGDTVVKDPLNMKEIQETQV